MSSMNCLQPSSSACYSNGGIGTCSWRRPPLTLPSPPPRPTCIPPAVSSSTLTTPTLSSTAYMRVDTPTSNRVPQLLSSSSHPSSPPPPPRLASAHHGECRGYKIANKVTSCILMFLASAATVALTAYWFVYCRQELAALSNLTRLVGQNLLRLGTLITEFNTEREWTVVYTTARSATSQASARASLAAARKDTDAALASVQDQWPEDGMDYGHAFHSPRLFEAILDRHRNAVKIGAYFWEEVQFYTNVIDSLLLWLNRDLMSYRPHLDHHQDRGEHGAAGEGVGLSQWLVAYSYLMASLNYVGGEQAMCTAFHSVVCFSHRETFYYANFTFSAEAVFRFYRQTFPADRLDGWRSSTHDRFFPSLASCRREIFADVDQLGIAIDPSLCDYARKNETTLTDVELITVEELKMIVDGLGSALDTERGHVYFRVLVAGGVLFSTVVFAIVTNCVTLTLVSRRGVCTRRKRNERGGRGKGRLRSRGSSVGRATVGLEWEEEEYKRRTELMDIYDERQREQQQREKLKQREFEREEGDQQEQREETRQFENWQPWQYHGCNGRASGSTNQCHRDNDYWKSNNGNASKILSTTEDLIV